MAGPTVPYGAQTAVEELIATMNAARRGVVAPSTPPQEGPTQQAAAPQEAAPTASAVPGDQAAPPGVLERVSGVLGLKNEHGEPFTPLDAVNQHTGVLGRAGEFLGRAASDWADYTRPIVGEAGRPVVRDAPLGGAPPVAVQPPVESGSGSASAAFSEGSPQFKAEQAGYIGDQEFRKAASQELDAVNQRADYEAKVAAETAKVEVSKQALAEEFAQTMASKEALVAEERDKLTANYNAAVAELGRIDPTIDPNRYWASKGTEQKISGFLAAALFGFAGKGLDFLSMVQQEIDRDIDMQKAEFNQRRTLAQDKVAGAKGAYSMLMERVQDERLARNTIRTARLSALDQQIATIAANAKPAGVKVAAAAARAGVQRELAKSKLEVDRVNAGTANHNATLRQQAALQNAELKFRFQAAQAAAAAGPKLEKGFSSEQKAISDLRSTIMGVRADMKEIRKVPGLAKLMDTVEPNWVLETKETAANVLAMAGIKAPAKFMNDLMANKRATKSLALRLYHSVAGVLTDREKEQALALFNRGGVNSESDLLVLLGMVKKLENDHDARIETARAQRTMVGMNDLTTEPGFGAQGAATAPPTTSQGPAQPATEGDEGTDAPQEGGEL